MIDRSYNMKLFCYGCRAMMVKNSYTSGCMVWFLIACMISSLVSIFSRGLVDIGLRWDFRANSWNIVKVEVEW